MIFVKILNTKFLLSAQWKRLHRHPARLGRPAGCITTCILILESHRFCNRVQDAYTMRCCPQVHGITHDTIEFVRGVITTEMNSATDNPVSLPRKNG